MNGIVGLLASLSAGISIGCLAAFIITLLEKIEVEKDELTPEITNKPLPILIKITLPLTKNVTKMANSDLFKESRRKAEDILAQAGYRQVISAEKFISAKIILGLIGMAFMTLFLVSGKPLFGLIIFLALFIYPMAWLNSAKKRRHEEILKALPNVLDLLTLSVQAGKDFLSSLRDILARRRIDALGEELIQTFQDIQLGKKRQEALKELSNRVKLSELTSVVNSIIQAEEMGVSIGHLLSIQGDQLRNKRFSKAEKLANEAPVKILFPMVIFIFPAVFLILMGPIILQALRGA